MVDRNVEDVLSRWRERFEDDRNAHRERIARELGKIHEVLANLPALRNEIKEIDSQIRKLDKDINARIDRLEQRVKVTISSVLGGTGVIGALITVGFMAWQIWASIQPSGG